MDIVKNSSYLTSSKWIEIQEFVKNRVNSLDKENYLVPEVENFIVEQERNDLSMFAAPSRYKTFAESLLELTTLKEIFDSMMSDENRQDVFDLTAEEIKTLEGHVNYIYNSIEEPTADDDEYKELIIDTLYILPNGEGELEGDPGILAITLPSVINGTDYGLVETSQKGLAISGDYIINGTCTFKTKIIVQQGKTLTITGAGTMSLDSASTDGFFLVEPGGKLIVKGNSTESIIINGNNKSYGAALWCQGEMELENVLVRDNHFKHYSGAAVYISASIENRTIKLTKCRFLNCNAPNGSVISLRNQRSYPCDFIIDKCVFENNGWTSQTSENIGEGGIIHVIHSGARYKLSITNSVFRNNTAFNGAAIYWKNLNADSELYVKDCQFINNTAVHTTLNEVEYGGRGGAIYITGASNYSKVTITGTAGTPSAALTSGLPSTLVGTLFQGNKAPIGGGAIYIDTKAPITIENTTINNCDSVLGSAILLDGTANGSVITFNAVKIQNCTSSATATSTSVYYGAVCVPASETIVSNYTLNVNNSTFTNNTAHLGGAISWRNGGILNITGSTFTGHKAIRNTAVTPNIGGAGAVIDFAYSTADCNITNSSFTDGNCMTAAALYFYSGKTITIKNSTFNNNLATSHAGAMMFETGAPTVLIEDCTINKGICGNGSAIMLAQGNGNFTIRRTIIENCEYGSYSGDGGVIRSVGAGNYKVLLDQCVIRNNSNIRGGAIYWNANKPDALMTVQDCQFLNNEATIKGGALYIEGTCEFKGSSGTLSPVISSGAIPAEGIIGTIIQGNSAVEKGGGICIASYNDVSATSFYDYNENNVTLGENVVVTGNTAPIGAGISYDIANSKVYKDNFVFNLNVEGAKISRNTAETYGGGVFIEYEPWRTSNGRDYGKDLGYMPRVNIRSGEISGNIADSGAGIFIAKGQCNISGGIIKENTATTDGGAIHLQDLAISGTVPTGVIANTKINITGGTLQANTAQTNGGAVSITNGDCFIESGNLIENIAISKGGACYITNGDIQLGTEECFNAGEDSTHAHPIIQYNIANDGAGIYIDGGSTIMWCGDIKYNHTYDGTVNLIVNKGYFEYNGGDIGSPFDSGITILGGEFVDNSPETAELLKKELHYLSGIYPTDEFEYSEYNARIQTIRWMNSPKPYDFTKEDTDASSPTWGEMFPTKTFIGWEEKEDSDNIITRLHALWE